MTPLERFKRKVKQLIKKDNCSLDVAFDKVANEIDNINDQGDKMLNIKQNIELELKLEENGDQKKTSQ